MRFPTPVLVPALLVLSVALAGCGSSDPDQAAVVTTEAPTTSTTIDPFAVPEVIDAAYVDKVLGELSSIRDSVTSTVATKQAFAEEDAQKLRTIYSGALEETQLEIFRRASEQEWPDAYRSATSDVEITELVARTTNCVSAKANISSLGLTTEFAYVLNRGQENPTGWVIVDSTLPSEIDLSASC